MIDQFVHSDLELRLLLALREEQHHHLILSIDENLFGDERNRLLFDAFRNAYKTYGNVQYDAVARFYRQRLPQEFWITVSVDPYPIIDELKRLYRKRVLYELSQDLRTFSSDDNPDFSHVHHHIDQKLRFSTRPYVAETGVDEFLSLFESRRAGSYRWLKTCIGWLDQMVGGEWPRGEVSLVTARSGGGKTALVGLSALNMAREHKFDPSIGSPTAIFSFEMPRHQLVARFVSTLAGIDSRIVRTGLTVLGEPVDEGTVELIKAAALEVSELPLFIVESEGFSADDVIAVARNLLVNHNVQAFFVDYLQLIQFDGESIHYGLGNAVKKLRNFAKEYNVAFVLAAQLNEQKNTIRDSSDPEKDAALWLHLSIDHDSIDDQGVMMARVEVRKNRHGPVGSLNLLYHPQTLSFSTRVSSYEPSA